MENDTRFCMGTIFIFFAQKNRNKRLELSIDAVLDSI